MNILYKITGLNKFYGQIHALDLPVLEISRGEMLYAVGPNGSGKSTLLRLLAFLETPTSGEIRFFEACDFPRRQVCLLLQEPYLFKESVFKNVTLGLRIRGIRKDHRDAYAGAMWACGFSDPAAFANRMPGQLSGGEKQRIALAALLVLKPAALLLDEPTSSVDIESSKAIASCLTGFLADGGTVVCATHDPWLPANLPGRKLDLAQASRAKT